MSEAEWIIRFFRNARPPKPHVRGIGIAWVAYPWDSLRFLSWQAALAYALWRVREGL